MLAIFLRSSMSRFLRTDLNNSEIRYTKNYIFSLQGVCTHATHLVCLRYWFYLVRFELSVAVIRCSNVLFPSRILPRLNAFQTFSPFWCFDKNRL